MERELSHDGYTGSVEYCADSEVFHGKLLSIEDLVLYEAPNEEKLRSSFIEAVEDYKKFLTYRDSLHKPRKPTVKRNHPSSVNTNRQRAVG